MIKQEPLFHSKKLKGYFWVGNPDCDVCGKEIIGLFMFITNFDMKQYNSRKICNKCIDEIKDLKSRFTEYRLVNTITEVCHDMVQVFIAPPILKDGDTSTIEASSLKSDHTIDRTRYAGRDPLTKLLTGDKPQIGTKLHEDAANETERDSNVPNIKKELESMKESRILIEDDPAPKSIAND